MAAIPFRRITSQCNRARLFVNKYNDLHEQCFWRLPTSISHYRNLVFRAPACTWRCADEGELLFALIHSGPILPEPGGGRQQASFAGFLAVLPHRQDRRRAAAAERPGNAREAARFRGKPRRRRPVPGGSPPSNRPGKQRFSVG